MWMGKWWGFRHTIKPNTHTGTLFASIQLYGTNVSATVLGGHNMKMSLAYNTASTSYQVEELTRYDIRSTFKEFKALDQHHTRLKSN